MKPDSIYTDNNLAWPGHCALCRTKFRRQQPIKTDGKNIFCLQHLDEGEVVITPGISPWKNEVQETRETIIPEWDFRHEISRRDMEYEEIWSGLKN